MKTTAKNFYKIISGQTENLDMQNNNFATEEIIALKSSCLSLFFDIGVKCGCRFSQWVKGYAYNIVVNNYKNISVQDEVLRILGENNIKCAVLKGTSCSVNYPDPMLRSLGDIDILVPESDYEKTLDIFVQERNKIKEMHKFHYSFVFNGILVEIHKEISDFDISEQDIKAFMKSAPDNLRAAKIDRYEFPVMAPEYEAVMLLIHTKRHYFENALTAKMLCDWGMFVSKADSIYWHSTIRPVLEKYNLGKWADALSLVCNKYLNIKCEDKIIHRCKNEIIEMLADKFVSDRLPEAAEEKSKKSMGKIIYFLNRIAYRDFKITKKLRFLLPIFWIVIGIRYIYRQKIGIRGKTDVLSYSRNIFEKEYLFEEIYKS